MEPALPLEASLGEQQQESGHLNAVADQVFGSLGSARMEGEGAADKGGNWQGGAMGDLAGGVLQPPSPLQDPPLHPQHSLAAHARLETPHKHQDATAAPLLQPPLKALDAAETPLPALRPPADGQDAAAAAVAADALSHTAHGTERSLRVTGTAGRGSVTASQLLLSTDMSAAAQTAAQLPSCPAVQHALASIAQQPEPLTLLPDVQLLEGLQSPSALLAQEQHSPLPPLPASEEAQAPAAMTEEEGDLDAHPASRGVELPSITSGIELQPSPSAAAAASQAGSAQELEHFKLPSMASRHSEKR